MWSQNQCVLLSRCVYHSFLKRQGIFAWPTISQCAFMRTKKAVHPGQSSERTACDEMYAMDKFYGKAPAMQAIQDTFNCSEVDAKSMLKSCPDLVQVKCTFISKNFKNLEENGIKKDTVMKNLWLLCLEQEFVTAAVKLVSKFGVDINSFVKFLSLPLERLSNLSFAFEWESKYCPEGNRVNLLITKLQCSPEEVCEMFMKYPFMFTVDFHRLMEILQLLLDAKVPTRSILKDVWIFRYKPSYLEYRLRIAQEAGITSIKPWMIRCKEDFFVASLHKKALTKNLLGTHSNVLEYLCHRLECSTEFITYLTYKYPALSKISVLKVNEMLEFLLNKGFTAEHVCHVPRILLHSLATVKDRLAELEKLQCTPVTLNVLCKSKHEYTSLIKKVKEWKSKDFTTKND